MSKYLRSPVKTVQGEVEAELRKLVRGKISGFAVPDTILLTPGLPKTR